MTVENDILRLGRNIQKLRQKKGFSIKNLSKKASISIDSVLTLEKGTGNPLLSTLYKISKALKTDLFTLCKGL